MHIFHLVFRRDDVHGNAHDLGVRQIHRQTAAQRVLDELILARVRVMTAPERTAFLAHVRDIVDSVEDNVTSVPVESVEPDDAEDTEEAE